MDAETTGFYDSNRYVFTTSSQSASGIFTRLKPYDVTEGDNPTTLADEGTAFTGTIRDTQPRVKVGNARSGTGTVTLDPGRVYTNDAAPDKLKSFTITYKSAGPIYDHSGYDNDDDGTIDAGTIVNASIVIDVPAAVTPVPVASPPADDPFVSNFSVTNTSGTVRFSSPRFDYAADTVTVNISRMSKDAQIVFTYKASDINGAETDSFVVTVNSGDGTTAADELNVPVKDKDDMVVTRLAYPKAGSGTLAISPSPVLAAGERERTFTLKYTAATDLGDAADEGMNVLLQITIPDAIVLPTSATQYLFDPAHSDYVSSSSGVNISTPVLAADIPDTPNPTDTNAEARRTIKWSIGSLAAGRSITISVKKVKVPTTADALTWEAAVQVGADSDAATFAGATELGTTGGNAAGMSAVLYVVKAGADDVAFSMDPDIFKAADTKQTITFTFEARNTPIEKGAVWFRIPSSGWTRPVDDAAGGDGDIGEVTAKIQYDGGTDGLFNTPAEGDIDMAIAKEDISTGYQTMIDVDKLPKGGIVVVTYKNASIQPTAEQGVKIYGYYNALSTSSSSRVSAGVVNVDISNVADGTGTAEIKQPSTFKVKAGSSDNRFEIEYKPVGTMDNGAVSLSIPTTAGWGKMQRDPEKPNHIDVRLNGRSLGNDQVSTNGDLVVAYLGDGFDHRDRLTFIYGGGTGADIGVKVQDTAGKTTFLIESRGSGAGSFSPVRGVELDGDPAAQLGEVHFKKDTTDYNGLLRIEVTGGDDGSGSATIEVTQTKRGAQDYIVVATDGTESTVNEPRVHAGDDSTYITLVYTASQPIINGQIQFIAPTGDGWSEPQESDRIAGYTRIESGGDIDPSVFNEDGSVTADIIDLPTGGTITIHYGSYAFASDTSGGATVPERAMESLFTINIKGSNDDDADLEPIQGTAKGEPLTVMVHPQASGGGTGMISNRGSLNLSAGAESTSITIEYEAEGEMVDGAVRLTIPAGWSMATSETVAVSRTTGVVLGGDLAADDLTEAGITNMQALVTGVSIDAGQTITFTYTGMVQAAKADDVGFMLASDGGAGPGEGVMDIADQSGLTVDVGQAAAGSGSVTVSPRFVNVGDEDVALTFTYTAAGTVEYPRIISVNVATAWGEPSTTSGEENYTVTGAERLAPNGQMMRARVANGTTLDGDGTVVFTYTVDAPTTTGTHHFAVSFDGSPVTGSLDDEGMRVNGSPVTVNVQPASGATDIMVNAPDSLNTEDGAVMITLQLAAEGSPASSEDPVEVTVASNSATGMFSETAADPDAETMPEYMAELTVTIAAGDDAVDIYYMDSTLGVSTITASAPSLTNPTGTAMISVDTDQTEVTAGTVDATPSIANAGTVVTVSADGTPNQDATFSVVAIVTDMGMDEVSSGSYSGSFTVVVDQHADGVYDVTVKLNGATATKASALTIDSTAPTVTASTDAGDTVGNGDTITITAMVTEDGSGVASVMADVSALDTTKGMVALIAGDDGSYSAEVTISEEGNEALNGTHAITVMATDNAGNESEMATAEVTLQNTLFYTSTLPAGISLYHVPLMVEGLDTVGDLETMLGESVTLLITFDGTTWNSRSSDVAITADLGILVSLSAETTITLEGRPWGDGDSMINLAAGSNLIGLPVNDARVTNVSDIAGLFDEGVVTGVVVASGSEFQLVAAAGDPADGPVAGDAAYLVMASAAGSAMVSGDGWENGSASAAPIALVGYTVDNQTPVLDVHGSVVDEITGLAKEGFRVKVKNLSTKAALSSISSVEVAEGYNMTFVDLDDSYAARVGDVLEISADSPNPLIGVQPVRHIVTVDDVKNGTIQLESLIAYEIPAETALLNNYPNPFNPETWIPYHLSEDADVKLTIYDINGEVVRDIDVGHQTAAKYDTRTKAIYWDGRNRFGEQVASGVYFYHLQAGDFSGTRKMVILK